MAAPVATSANYTIPSDNRELQHSNSEVLLVAHYTIPSDNRELQRDAQSGRKVEIIPYQVITGNYNSGTYATLLSCIIPYQVITGNYNSISK